MRKIAYLTVISVVIVMLGIIPAFCVDTSLKVYDDAGLFSSSEYEKLQDRTREIGESKQFDIVIVTTGNADGKTAQAYADDFYDYNGFGYGNDKTGVLLLIDMDNTEVAVSGTGKGKRFFNDSVIQKILDDVTPYLTAAEYAQGANAFLDFVETTPTAPLERTASRSFIYILVAVAIAGISVGIMSINNKGKKTTTSNTYLDPNSFVLNDNRDIYIRTAVTKRYINTSSGGGGGHTGSSGTSHSGGSRHF